MLQSSTEKCSYGTSVNQLVAMVLSNPNNNATPTCDIWRFWSQKKGNAAFHQTAMKEIAPHHKATTVPSLELVKLKSDGQRAQYKGRKNFGQMAEWPHANVKRNQVGCFCQNNGDAACGNFMEPGLGIKMQHDFSPSHHGSNSVDNYGKDAPKAMDRDTLFKQSTLRYDYNSCYQWCIDPKNKMDKPSEKKEHRGIFGADGAYHWRAYAKFDDGHGHPIVPADRDFQALDGSNEMYSFRAVNKYAPEIQADYVPCCCTGCRDASGSCLYTIYTRAHVENKAGPELFMTHAFEETTKARKKRKRQAKGGGSESESEGE
jgi:hypothetical protein